MSNDSKNLTQDAITNTNDVAARAQDNAAGTQSAAARVNDVAASTQNTTARANDAAGKKNWFEIFKLSLGEFRKLRVITFCGLMAALAIVLNYVASIQIGPYVRIGFSNVPNVIVDFLFGPAVGGIFAGVLDILKLMLKPSGAYFPGFTLSAVLGGLIYGFAFYRKPVSVKRVFLANLIVKVFDNIILNSLWLHIMYGKALAALLPARIVSNAVMLPVDTALFYLILKAADRTIRREFVK